MKAILVGLVLGSFATTSFGQSLEEKVKTALSDVAQGKCSQDLLAPMLRAACDSQPQTKTHLGGLGAIESLESYGVQAFPNGSKPTVFRVTFEKGIMTWAAEEAPDGKLAILWSDMMTAPR